MESRSVWLQLASFLLSVAVCLLFRQWNFFSAIWNCTAAFPVLDVIHQVLEWMFKSLLWYMCLQMITVNGGNNINFQGKVSLYSTDARAYKFKTWESHSGSFSFHIIVFSKMWTTLKAGIGSWSSTQHTLSKHILNESINCHLVEMSSTRIC